MAERALPTAEARSAELTCKLCRCEAQQRSSCDYGEAEGDADGEGEAFSLLFFFDDEDFFFEVALFSDALADAAPPFLLPLLEVDDAAIEFELPPGVLLD